jgi:HEAT repeat protein
MRKLLLVGLALLLLVLAAIWLEPTRFLLGFVSGDSFYQNRPTRYWRERLSAEDPAQREAARERLASGGAEAVGVLTELLAAPESDWQAAEIRWTAAELLAEQGPAAQSATAVLLRTLKDADPHVRRVAASSLPQIDAPSDKAVPALLALTRREPTVVSLRALSEYGEQAEEAIPALIELLNNQELETELRWNAARTLGKIRSAAVVAVPALVENLSDEAATVREHSAEALGDIGPAAKESVPALIAVLADPATRVRRDAARSLGQIGPSAVDAVPHLVKLIDDPETLVRDAARVAILTLAPDQPLPDGNAEQPDDTEDPGGLP